MMLALVNATDTNILKTNSVASNSPPDSDSSPKFCSVHPGPHISEAHVISKIHSACPAKKMAVDQGSNWKVRVLFHFERL